MNIQGQLDIDYHRSAAATYEQDVIETYRFYDRHGIIPVIQRLIARVPAALALDLGTGTGKIACYLAQFGCRVHAIDHSPEMLAVAQKKAADMEVSVQFAVGDAQALAFPDCHFDAVTINAVLHHLADYGPILREAVRVLKPGGLLYVAEPCIEKTIASRIINKTATTIRRTLRLPGRIGHPADHERPLSGPELVTFIRSLGISGEPEFLVDLGISRFLPERFRIYPVLLLSLPTRRNHGDILSFEGRKQ